MPFPSAHPTCSCCRKKSPFDEVHYFGDIDAAGFDIAAPAEQAVLALGGRFAFRPAAGLYRALLAAGTPVGEYGAMTAAARSSSSAMAWRGWTGRRVRGRRIPQEALARPALRAVLKDIRL